MPPTSRLCRPIVTHARPLSTSSPHHNARQQLSPSSTDPSASPSLDPPPNPKSTRPSRPTKSISSNSPPDHNYNTNSAYHYLVDDRTAHFSAFPSTTARSLSQHATQPRSVKLLARDFIDDALYHPSYGYFAKQAVILSPEGEGFEFGRFRDNSDFQAHLSDTFRRFETSSPSQFSKSPAAPANAAPAHTGSTTIGQRRRVGQYSVSSTTPTSHARDEGKDPDRDGPSETLSPPPRQVWQTPTEMFKPHYGIAIARYLVTQYKLTTFPYHDLLIYEVGAGNGTLMMNVLDYLRAEEPEVYTRTRYKIIEISAALSKRQRARYTVSSKSSPSSSSSSSTRETGTGSDVSGSSIAKRSAEGGGHGDRVEVINKSIFDWDATVPEPCFFLALEVFDNFAHDALRYDLESGRPYQSLVAIDEAGDYHELLSPSIDPLTTRYLTTRAQIRRNSGLPDRTHPSLSLPSWFRKIRASLPFTPNLTTPEFVPTKLLQFLEILHAKFPQHRLLASDFHALPDAMDGINAPVVQTRYKGTMVPCSTYLVYPGYFDIMFPTDFDELSRFYAYLGNVKGGGGGYFSHVRRGGGGCGRVFSHAEFLKSWGDVEGTTTRSGENPMLEFYENASFIVT